MLGRGDAEVMGAPTPSSSPSSSRESDRDRIEYELRGKTLKVYLFILKQRKPVGVREVQRELGFSSPSVAYHHIEKLTRQKLVVVETHRFHRAGAQNAAPAAPRHARQEQSRGGRGRGRGNDSRRGGHSRQTTRAGAAA